MLRGLCRRFKLADRGELSAGTKVFRVEFRQRKASRGSADASEIETVADRWNEIRATMNRALAAV